VPALLDRLPSAARRSPSPAGRWRRARTRHHLWRDETGDRPVPGQPSKTAGAGPSRPSSVPVASAQPSWRCSAPAAAGFTGRWMTGSPSGPKSPGARLNLPWEQPCGHPCGSCACSSGSNAHRWNPVLHDTARSQRPHRLGSSPDRSRPRRRGLTGFVPLHSCRGGGALRRASARRKCASSSLLDRIQRPLRSTPGTWRPIPELSVR